MNYTTGPGNYKSRYVISVVKQVDETVNNSNTLQDDDELGFIGMANKIYGIQVCIFGSVTAGNFRTGWSLPSGASGSINISTLSGGTAQVIQDITTLDTHTWNAGSKCLFMYGRIVMGSTPGNCIFQWAQNVADVSDTKVLQGSFLVVVVS